ncbi:MAG TPA: hypothetical protein VMV46_09830 [Thermoanaerobaculia bacterium]|nr:hypothetical protein [Thermoanaerobaculia bacterium]
MVRSLAALIGAVMAIAVTVVVGIVIATTLLASPDGSVTGHYLGANVAVSFAAAVLGGWLIARLAPRRPIVHATVLATVLVLLALPGLENPAPGQPPWYPSVILGIGIAGVAFGALVAGRWSARSRRGGQHA